MKRFAAGFAALAFFAAVGSASATSVVFNLTSEFSGASDPTNILTATFDDGGGSGTVTLTLTMSGTSTTEFVSDWFFNYGGGSAIAFALASDNTGAGTPPAVSQGSNAFQADGDGLYDIKIAFDTSPPAQRFTTGETVVFTITGTGITATDFDVLSAPAGGSGPFETAAHVQGIGPDADGSGWVTIPEPSGAILFGLGTLLAGAAIRRRS